MKTAPRIKRISAFALLLVFQAALPGAPKKKDPLADDPLLRERWISREARRARGLAHRVAGAIERPAGKISVTDARGRVFRLDASGRITFNPYDDNWKPVLPRPSDAPLHLAEADALSKSGLIDEALAIYRALVAMAHLLPDAPGHVKKTAERAAQRINRMNRDNARFHELEFRTDPYIFYNDAVDETVLLSDRHGFRMTLPGLWRFARARNKSGRPHSSEFNETLVYLKQQNIRIMAGADLFRRAYRIRNLKGYSLLWDRRRTLSVQRKDRLNFSRAKHGDNKLFCGKDGVLSRTPRTASRFERIRNSRIRTPQLQCRLLTSDLTSKKQRSNFLEFYRLNPTGGFFLGINFLDKDEQVANDFMRDILKKIHFTSAASRRGQ